MPSEQTARDAALRAQRDGVVSRSSSTATLVDAWQAALAAEHQACFGYALLGPQLSGATRQLAAACADAHEALRDRTTSEIAAADRTPVEPRADYPALYPVTDAAAARDLAARLEDDCAAAWRYLYAIAADPGFARGHTSSTNSHRAGSLRASAQAALTASAVRGTRWRLQRTPGKATVPFPGIS